MYVVNFGEMDHDAFKLGAPRMVHISTLLPRINVSEMIYTYISLGGSHGNGPMGILN